MTEEHIKAILIDAPGGPEVMKLGDHPKPFAGPGRVLVKNYAAGVNGADLLQRKGNYSPPEGMKAAKVWSGFKLLWKEDPNLCCVPYYCTGNSAAVTQTIAQQALCRIWISKQLSKLHRNLRVHATISYSFEEVFFQTFGEAYCLSIRLSYGAANSCLLRSSYVKEVIAQAIKLSAASLCAGGPQILGLEAAGEVVEDGSEEQKYKKGDRVMALLDGGG